MPEIVVRLSAVLLVVGIVLIVVALIPPANVAYLLTPGIVCAVIGAAIWVLDYVLGRRSR